MLIKKLVDYAIAHRLVDDPLFETKPVNFTVNVRSDGRLLGVQPVGDSRGGLPSRVPKKVGGNAGGVATFGTDNARFVLGIVDDPASAGKAMRDAEAFKKLIAAAADDDPHEPELAVAAAFYADAEQVSAARQEAKERGAKESSRLALVVGDGGIHLANTAAGTAFWRRHRESQELAKEANEAVDCLSCGEVRPPVAINDTKIMGLQRQGGQPSGTALVSFDKDSFQSFGWDKNANAAICEPCSQAYTRALNDLLQPGNPAKTRADADGVAYVAWSDAEQPVPVFPAIDDPPVDLRERLRRRRAGETSAPISQPTASRARELIAAPDHPGGLPRELPGHLFVLGLRGNGGRAVVVDWFDVTLEKAYQNVGRWFEDIEIQLIFDQRHARTDPVTKAKAQELVRPAGAGSGPVPRWMLARSTIRDGEDVPGRTSAALVRAALKGEPLPLTIAEALLERLRREENPFGDYFAPARIGLLRCVLNRLPGKKRTLGTMLDRTESNPAYVCGRLLATLEGVQYAGVGDVGATVIDRFYGRASTAPRLVFGQLLSLAQAHLGAINNIGLRVNLEKEIEEITDLLGPELPPSFSVEDQGRFAIGYWHQKAHRMTEIRERREARLYAESQELTQEN